MVNILIGFVIILIMFSIGLTLTLDKFKVIIKSPKAFIIGLSTQMLVLPALAFGFCLVSNISPEWKVGLFILSLCPGGTTSNFLSYLLKGNTELSVAMTSANSILTLFSIPLLSNFALNYFLNHEHTIQLAYGETVFQLLIITLLPVIIGLTVKTKFPKVTKLLAANFKVILKGKTIKVDYLKLITISLLGIMFSVKLFAPATTGGIDLSLQDVLDALPVVLSFNILGLTLGYLISKLLKLNQNTSMTIGIEIGLQNTSLALLIIGGLLQNISMQKPVLVYALISFWTALLFGLLTRKKTTSKGS